MRGELSYLYRVRDGKVSRVEIYPTREEALAAVRPQTGSRGEVD